MELLYASAGTQDVGTGVGSEGGRIGAKLGKIGRKWDNDFLNSMLFQ